MSGHKRYPTYKDSGVKWIGQLPENWDVKPIYSVASLRNGFPFKSERFATEGEAEDRLIRIRDISGDDNAIYTSEAAPENAIVDTGDLLVGMDGDFNVHLWSRGKAKLNQRMCALESAQEEITPFLHYCLPFPLGVINDLTYATTVKHLSGYEVLHSAVPLPSRDEIIRINTYLDRETARIDALIEKKTRFIELLKEKRQALITQAVTKGLDPTVPMKDSGVEWIGEVPAHWRVLPIKRLLSIPITDGPHETPTKQVEGIPFVSAEAVRTGHIDFDKIWGYISEADHARYSKKYKPKVGDIYMVKSGATTGITAMVEDPREFNIWSPLAAMRPNNLVEPNYLLASLRSTSFLDGVAINWSYGTQQNIGMKTLSDLPVAVPSREKQRNILSSIAREEERVAKLLNATNRSIDLLKERRSALINAAVTGQIDLREDAA